MIEAAKRAPRVHVFYHFFPHYRAGVIKELQRSFAGIKFFGSPKGVAAIEVFDRWNEDCFKPVRTYWFGSVVLQPAIILWALVGRFDCGVFLADPNHLTTWIAAALCKIRGRRVVFWGHGFKSADLSAKNRLRRLFFGLADAFFTYGYRAKRAAVEMGFDPASVYVGFNSLDYSRQMAARTRCSSDRLSDASLQIACISRLTKECRYDLLFDAVVFAKGKGLAEPALLFVGDGPERVVLESQARSLGLRAQFIGSSYDEDVIAKILYDADVTVSPGKVGLTAMHSLMYGTPVISNSNFIRQMPEVEAIVPSVTGELFVEGDIEDLANKLLAFKARFPDRERTRLNCFRMIDEVYNPMKQVDVLGLAVRGEPAPEGHDAFEIFKDELCDASA